MQTQHDLNSCVQAQHDVSDVMKPKHNIHISKLTARCASVFFTLQPFADNTNCFEACPPEHNGLGKGSFQV